MIGVDASEEMLELAYEKRAESGHDILYLLQDMREFELYGTVRAIVSVCDSLNYITEEEELLHVFRLVRNYLDPDGVFLFDMNTIYKYSEMLGETTICGEPGGGKLYLGKLLRPGGAAESVRPDPLYPGRGRPVYPF